MGRSRQASVRKTLAIPISLVVAVVTSLVWATPVAAVDTEPPELVDIEISPDTVSVAGLAVEEVTISMHLTDETGVHSSHPYSEFPSPGVTLLRVDGTRDFLKLSLASGTPQDGIWTEEVLVPSSYDGSWVVSHVAAMDTNGYWLDVDPASLGIVRTLEVTGTHQPKLTLFFSPRPAQLGSRIYARGRLTDADTGEPYAGQVLFVGHDYGCTGESFWRGGHRIRTDANGFYRVRVPAVTLNRPWNCVYLVRPVPPWPAESFDWTQVTFLASRRGVPVVKIEVTARPSARSIPLGGRIRISGRVLPRLWAKIYLQRLTQRGWRTESVGQIRFDRYSVHAQPPFRGVHRYRVVRPSIPRDVVGDASPVFVLTAT